MSNHAVQLLESTSDKRTPRLCKVCGQIGTRDSRWIISPEKNTWPSLGVFIHRRDLHSLQASALKGCTLCQFFLSSIVNGDDARHVPTIGDDIVQSTLFSVRTRLKVADRKRFVQRHSHELSPAIAYVSPTRSTDTKAINGLHLLSKLCGHGRVVLIGSTCANILPINLRVVVLYPFGAFDIQDVHTPFITGLPFELAPSLDDPLEPMASAWTVSPTLFTDSLIQRIRGWRDECLSQHPKCRGMRGRQPLPTRVIEINVDTAPHIVKLGDGRGQHGIYAALSYCWGTCSQRKTTKSTLQEHLVGIRVSMLPATIQDAIKLCRSLSIPYLWVDSLCILQDDSKDWHHEAAEMAAIYGRSALTITTPSNSQCDESFNTVTIKQQEGPPSPELLWENHHEGKTVTGTVTVRPKALKSNGGPPFPFSIGNTDSPWMTRGWTLQEWLLSPRVLHCGSERVWDCYQTWYTETCLTYAPPSGTLNDTSKIQDGLASHIFARMARLDPTILESGLDTHWACLVEEFTSRTLSHEMDKMPAIAGLATRFMEHSHVKAPGAKYLAGLWYYKGLNPFGGRTYPTSQIPLGLLWRRSTAEFMRSPATYRAPSWSWAALDGPVSLFHPQWPLKCKYNKSAGLKEVEEMKVETARCLFDPPDSCSLVQTGWIVAIGPLTRAFIKRSWASTQFHSILPSEYSKTFVRLGTGHKSGKGAWYGVFDQSPEQTGINYVDESLYLLHVATVIPIRGGYDQVSRAIHHALLLERVGRFDNIDCFARLGVAWHSLFWSSDEKDMIMDWKVGKVRLI